VLSQPVRLVWMQEMVAEPKVDGGYRTEKTSNRSRASGGKGDSRAGGGKQASIIRVQRGKKGSRDHRGNGGNRGENISNKQCSERDGSNVYKGWYDKLEGEK